MIDTWCKTPSWLQCMTLELWQFVLRTLTWNVLEYLHRLVHRFVGIVDILLDRLRVDACQRVVHPTVIPLEPVGHCDPQVLEWLKVLEEFWEFLILQQIITIKWDIKTTNTSTTTTQGKSIVESMIGGWWQFQLAVNINHSLIARVYIYLFTATAST